MVMKSQKNINYKGYVIDRTTYCYITVFYAGDDYMFQTTEEAKKFIDSIVEKEGE